MRCVQGNSLVLQVARRSALSSVWGCAWAWVGVASRASTKSACFGYFLLRCVFFQGAPRFILNRRRAHDTRAATTPNPTHPQPKSTHLPTASRTHPQAQNYAVVPRQPPAVAMPGQASIPLPAFFILVSSRASAAPLPPPSAPSDPRLSAQGPVHPVLLVLLVLGPLAL